MLRSFLIVLLAFSLVFAPSYGLHQEAAVAHAQNTPPPPYPGAPPPPQPTTGDRVAEIARMALVVGGIGGIFGLIGYLGDHGIREMFGNPAWSARGALYAAGLGVGGGVAGFFLGALVGKAIIAARGSQGFADFGTIMLTAGIGAIVFAIAGGILGGRLGDPSNQRQPQPAAAPSGPGGLAGALDDAGP